MLKALSFYANMHRRWLVNRTNTQYIEYLSRTASISPVMAQILINRGIKTPQDIYDFLNPKIADFSDPFELIGLRTAVERLQGAVKREEKVLVHGDYDADGLSATAILVSALKDIGLDVCYFIPNRIAHGYGFNLAGVEKAKELGVKLIITVDCGITSFEAAAISKKVGIDVIITDHHEPQRSIDQQNAKSSREKPIENKEQCFCATDSSYSDHSRLLLPDALVIINPKVSHPQSPLSNLSGAGIAFKFAQALDISCHGSWEMSTSLLDLAAIGTIADVIPITGENRLLVREGLRLIDRGERQGLRALKKISGIDEREVKSGLLPFTVIPRINAAGRASDASDVVRLFLTNSEDEAIAISTWLDGLNSERQRIGEEVYREALSKLENSGVRSAIVLSSEGWHPGIIGIVASRIAETFYRPAFIISTEGRAALGSARSIPPFDIYKGLTGCKELLAGFGGHKQAAGFRLDAENISSFEEMINTIVEETLVESDFTPSLEIDADVNLSHINFALIKELALLEPFGFRNPSPLLGSKGLEVVYPRIVGNNHLKMKLKQRSQSLDAIGFDMGSFFEKLEVSTTIDAVFTPVINDWEGGRCLQLNLKAFRPSL
jgi:single-stranded-DNA-specific exonuclease